MPVISKALGHANPRNTLIYIRQLSDEQLSAANHRLLDLILKKLGRNKKSVLIQRKHLIQPH